MAVDRAGYGLAVQLAKVAPTGDIDKPEEHTVFSAARGANAEEDADELFTLITMLSTVFGRPNEAYEALLAAGLIKSKVYYDRAYEDFLGEELSLTQKQAQVK